MERQPVGIEPADDLVMVRIKPGRLNEAIAMARRFNSGPVILVSDKLTRRPPRRTGNHRATRQAATSATTPATPLAPKTM